MGTVTSLNILDTRKSTVRLQFMIFLNKFLYFLGNILQRFYTRQILGYFISYLGVGSVTSLNILDTRKSTVRLQFLIFLNTLLYFLDNILQGCYSRWILGYFISYLEVETVTSLNILDTRKSTVRLQFLIFLNKFL